MTAAGVPTVETANDPLKAVAAAMANAAHSVREGAGDAYAKARQAVPVTGQLFSRFVYSGSYYLSYGVVFPTLLVAKSIPGGGQVASGLFDGATAANAAIGAIKNRGTP